MPAAIYDDQAPHVVVSKAAQVGDSTYAILRSLHACATGLNVIYFFPTRTDVLDFSRSRVTPLLVDNPFLSRMVTDTDTTGLKRIGDAHLYMRGMQSTVGMKSVPADLLIFDDLDETDPVDKSLALERLSHSDYKLGCVGQTMDVLRSHAKIFNFALNRPGTSGDIIQLTPPRWLGSVNVSTLPKFVTQISDKSLE